MWNVSNKLFVVPCLAALVACHDYYDASENAYFIANKLRWNSQKIAQNHGSFYIKAELGMFPVWLSLTDIHVVNGRLTLFAQDGCLQFLPDHKVVFKKGSFEKTVELNADITLTDGTPAVKLSDFMTQSEFDEIIINNHAPEEYATRPEKEKLIDQYYSLHFTQYKTSSIWCIFIKSDVSSDFVGDVGSWELYLTWYFL